MNHTDVDEHENALLEVDPDGQCDDPMETEGELTVINPSDDEDDDGGMSSEGSNDVSQDGFNENNEEFMVSAMGEEVTAQLAAAGWQKQHLHGPIGMAAAAAIVSSKKRKRLHSFETNPSIRKRQQNRLLRKLRQTIDEFSTRVGMQAVVLLATPGKENTGFKVFGAKPLEDVIRTMKGDILAELETALSQHAPPQIPDDPSLYELPPLVLDGIPTPIEKMTQAQLRAFIPLMLKYSTGRGKPGWGRESTKPPWWPIDLPWANVRMDARTEEEKQRVSWTRALRQIVLNCYKYHGREDLLPTFTGEEEILRPEVSISPQPVHTPNNVTSVLRYTPKASPPSPHSQNAVSTHYTQTVLQTYTNPDGTVSIIQVDPNHPIITLPDGTTAHVQGLATIHTGQNGHDHTVQSLNDVGNSSNDNVTSVDLLNNVTEATLNQDGQLILTGEDGHGYPVSVSGMLSVPVSGSMYQTVVANIQHISNDGSLQVTPVMQVPKTDSSDDYNTNEVETITVAPHQVITMSSSSDSQVLQVISIKNAGDLKSLTSGAVNQQIKIDEEMIDDQ